MRQQLSNTPLSIPSSWPNCLIHKVHLTVFDWQLVDDRPSEIGEHYALFSRRTHSAYNLNINLIPNFVYDSFCFDIHSDYSMNIAIGSGNVFENMCNWSLQVSLEAVRCACIIRNAKRINNAITITRLN